MKSTRLLSIPVYSLFGIALLISAGCKKTPGSPASVTHTISFSANGGTGDSPAAIIFTYNQENIRAPEKPTGLSAPAEKDFAGWNTKADGSGTDYAVGASLNTLIERAQDATLYARWKGWVVTTFAGSYSGTTDGSGTAARFNYPSSVAVDKKGNIYVADEDNHRIRKITPVRGVTTFAGYSSGIKDGTGTAAQFYFPSGVAVDKKGNIYVADRFSHRIRRITSAGVVSSLAATGGFSQNSGTATRFNFPRGVAVDSSGNIYVADRSNHCIQRITPAREVTTFAGSSKGYRDGSGRVARFNFPSGVAVDSSGNIYVADTDNHRIRKITAAGEVTTIAGGSSTDQPERGTTDDSGTAARFNQPFGVAVDSSGNIYVADSSNHRIRKITPEREVSTIAGGSSTNQPESGYTNGFGTAARFKYPRGVAVDSSGNIYVADTENHHIRKIEYK